MDLSAWVVYTFIAALAMAASVAHYRLREPVGKGRAVLGLTRGAALGLIVLLLFDPDVPTGGGSDRPVVALVDASLSMSLTDEEGASRWDRAREAVAESGADRIQLFGLGEDRSVSDLAEVEPLATRSRLAPGLRGVLEANVGGVVVVTDGAIEDAAEVRRIAAEASIPITVRRVGDGTRGNLSLHEVEVPGWLEAGELAAVRFTVARSGAAGAPLPDSAAVVLTRSGRELGRTLVAVPSPGRGSSGELRFRPAEAVEGAVRLDLAVEPGGTVQDDDVRSRYVRVAEEPAGVVVVSLRPDQEPRFLFPVLDRALALPVRGWIGLAEDRFLALGIGSEAGVVTTGAVVRRAVADAALVVVHGIDEAAPAWARAAIDGAERVLVFPADPAPPLPVGTGARREGDWYLAPEVPSSPVASLLAGTDMTGVPPLVALRTLTLEDDYWTPLVARLGRRGEAYPVVAVGAPAGRRVAIALGDGYWRWAFAGPGGHDVYERMWSALAGWLSEDIEIEREAIRPVSRVVVRGERVGWTAPPSADSLGISIRRQTVGEGPGEGAPDESPPVDRAAPAAGSVMDTVVAVEGGRAFTASLSPGHYRYTARAGTGAAMEGAFTVESYSPEFVDAPGALEEVAAGTGEEVGLRGGRPLRTSPWPYVLVVGLLCVEWVLRRRWGLR